MTKLSVNVNKVATLRNARLGEAPSPAAAARICLAAGAAGITVHPRPDARHIRFADVRELAALVRGQPGAELNVEGNPFPAFLELVCELAPDQCTLVPDAPEALTSNAGWDLGDAGAAARLRPIVARLRALGIRVSLFLDADASQVERAAALGADRIELYTEPYARAFGTSREAEVLARYVRAAEAAGRVGLGVNAGHDLDVANLAPFCREVPGVLEVSIGHALIARAFDVGLERSVHDYLRVLDEGRMAAAAPS